MTFFLCFTPLHTLRIYELTVKAFEFPAENEMRILAITLVHTRKQRVAYKVSLFLCGCLHRHSELFLKSGANFAVCDIILCKPEQMLQKLQAHVKRQ